MLSVKRERTTLSALINFYSPAPPPPSQMIMISLGVEIDSPKSAQCWGKIWRRALSNSLKIFE